MKRILYSALMFLTVVSFQSCLHEEEDLFDKSAEERLTETISSNKRLLESAANGWIMQYTTGRGYTGGGYTLLMKFANGKAQIASDKTEGAQTATSSYDIESDRGPVLTFNTYNANLHPLAEVTISDVDGQQGDYEFVIMKSTQDTIWVKGKKYGNYMQMTRIPSNVTWNDYLNGVAKMKEDMWYSYKMMQNADSVGTIFLEPEKRNVVINSETGNSTVPYFVTPEGVEFAHPITLGNVVTNKLIWNKEEESLKIQGHDDVLQPFQIKGWKPYDFYNHNWNIYYNNWQGTLNLSCKPKSSTKYEASFTSSSGVTYTFELSYNKAYGTLSWLAQDLADPTGKYDHLTMMMIYSGASGSYITWNPSVGFVFYVDENGYISLKDNGALGVSTVSGVVIDGVDKNGNRTEDYPVTMEGLAGGYVYAAY